MSNAVSTPSVKLYKLMALKARLTLRVPKVVHVSEIRDSET